MTPVDVARARVELGLSVAEFAGLVGVHASTVYRWESDSLALRLEPFQRQLITVILMHLGGATEFEREALGLEVSQGLAVGGPLRGLFRLLSAVFREWDLSGKLTTARPPFDGSRRD